MAESRIRGRWQLQRWDNPGPGVFTVAWGEFPAPDSVVPVVPCDEAAIERAAKAMSNQGVLSHRQVAEIVLRAAGKADA